MSGNFESLDQIIETKLANKLDAFQLAIGSLNLQIDLLKKDLQAMKDAAKNAPDKPVVDTMGVVE